MFVEFRVTTNYSRRRVAMLAAQAVLVTETQLPSPLR